MYASKQAPFLITETNAGAIGGPATNFPAYDGQWRQAAWAFVARGAEMIEYWHWHTIHFGTETYWVGILPARPAARPGLRRAQPARRRLPRGRSRVVGLRPDAQVGLLYSARSKWGLAFQAAFSQPGKAFVSVAAPTSTSGRTTGSSRPSIAAPSTPACRARIIHDNQIIGPDGTRLSTRPTVAAELPVLIVPGLLVADDALLIWLRDYAAAGGHLVIGPRTAYGDDEGRARIEVKPAHLADAAGVRYQEFSNLDDPVPVTAESDGFSLSDAARGDRLGRRPDQRRSQGDPRLRPSRTSASSRPSSPPSTAAAGSPPSAPCPTRRLPPTWSDGWRQAPSEPWGELPPSVTVQLGDQRAPASGSTSSTTGAWKPVRFSLPRPMTDLLADAGELDQLELGPWDVRVLAG